MAKKKTWKEKLNENKSSKIKKIEFAFADIPAGSNMFIATPNIIENYIKNISFGRKLDIKTMRKDLALENGADNTCPVTSGIFLRIVAEAAFEDLQNGKSADEITPFWRIISPDSPLAKKLSFGQELLLAMQKEEEI